MIHFSLYIQATDCFDEIYMFMCLMWPVSALVSLGYSHPQPEHNTYMTADTMKPFHLLIDIIFPAQRIQGEGFIAVFSAVIYPNHWRQLEW